MRTATYKTYDFVWFEVGGVTYRYDLSMVKRQPLALRPTQQIAVG